ncbi:MAG: hypothetical protein ACRCZY_04470 [Phocaeicola sp.]
MGKCKYCGIDAGFFKSKHNECEAAYLLASTKLTNMLLAAFKNFTDFYTIDTQIKNTIKENSIAEESLQNIYVQALDQAILHYLDDGLISVDESRTVARFQQYTGLPQQVLNVNRSLEKVVQAGILQQVLNGIIPTPAITIQGGIPFLLQKNEKIIWIFRNVAYYQQKTRREMRGRTQGMSFRVMKGVYYRVGGFKGTPIETTHNEYIDTGVVGLTDKHLYFSSPKKSFKLPYNKIIDIQSYSDGIGLQKEGATSQPLTLKGVDSWFVYNLITNIIQL